MQEAHAHRVVLVLTEAVSCWCDSALGVVAVERARVEIHGGLSQHVCGALPTKFRDCRCTRSITWLPVRFRGVPLRRPLDTLADQPDDEFQLALVAGALDNDPAATVAILVRLGPASIAEFGGSLRWEAEVDARVIHPVQMHGRDRIPLRRERCLARAEVRGTSRPHSAGVDRWES